MQKLRRFGRWTTGHDPHPSLQQQRRPGAVESSAFSSGREESGSRHHLRPSYVEDLLDHLVRGNQNVFAFNVGVASLEGLQLLSMVIAPNGLADTGTQNYHFVTGNLDIHDRG